MSLATVKSTFSALGQIALLLLLVVWSINSGADAMGYEWQWHRVPEFIAVYEDGEWWATELLLGLQVTLQISAISLLFTLLIGFVTALLKRSDSMVGRTLANLYIELIRNTPLLVQIYLLYFVFGPIIGLDRFATAVLALSLFQGAYAAEVIRGGLNAIPKGQFEAAHSLGMSTWHSYRYVIVPQLLQRILPPLTNEAVSLIKNSSIVSVMAIFDLTTEARNIVADTAMPFEIWFTAAAIYLLLTLTLSAIAALLERRLGAGWRHP